jgi:hypothetical protein
MVVVRHRFLRRPSRPAARISRATRRLPQVTSWRRSAWCTRGDPYVPFDSSWILVIFSVIAASAAARGEGTPDRRW